MTGTEQNEADYGVLDHAEGAVTLRTMLAFDPPKLLEVAWGDQRLRFELEPDAGGSNAQLFGVVHRTRPRGQGWRRLAHVPRLLGFDVSGHTPPWTSDDRWRMVIESYRTEFGVRRQPSDRPGSGKTPTGPPNAEQRPAGRSGCGPPALSWD